MPVCCVANCSNSDRKGYRVFGLPCKSKSYRRREQWLINAGLREEDIEMRKGAPHFCEGHFTPECFEAVNLDGWMLLRKDAVPNIFVDNPPKTVSLICGRKKRAPFANVQQLPVQQQQTRPLSPVAECMDADQFLAPEIPAQLLSPISKRRRSASICDENVPEVDKLRSALSDMTTMYNRCRKMAAQYKVKAENLSKNLKKFLNEDQIALLQLEDPSRNSKEWSDETIKTALQMRLMVRSKGYEFLRQQLKWPLPSFRTLCRRLQDLQFLPGKTDEIVKFLPDKVIDPEDPSSHLCVLTFDEMKLEEGVSYDRGLKRCLGLVTPSLAHDENEQDKLATHVLNVVLKGLRGHWKQSISYAFTTQTTKPDLLWNYLKSVIVDVHKVGLKVTMLSADMGGTNTAIGNLLGVYSTKIGVQVFFPHPVQGEADIIWNGDLPHALKNFWVQLTKTDMKLPGDVQQMYDLPSRDVSVKHVAELLQHQNVGGGKLVPKLTQQHLNPSQFEKMRVGMATVFFSESLGMALIFLAEKGLISAEARTTGWFVVQMAKWYKLMVNRHIFDSLGTDEHTESRLHFLRDFIDLVNRVTFSGSRKPAQNAIALTTTAALELHNKYVVNGPLNYVLTSRTTTSSVENTFCQIRAGGVVNPTAARVRSMLRLISVGQFLHVSKYSSYEADNDEHAVDFLKSASKQRKSRTQEEEVMDDWESTANEVSTVDVSAVNLTFVEECGLYYMSGWAASRVNNKCEDCRNAVRSASPLDIAESGWTEMISRGGLAHPTPVVYHVHYTVEKIFQALGTKVLKMQNPADCIIELLHKEISPDILESLPHCHNVLGLVVDKFVRLRMHIATKDFSQKEVIVAYSSKSAFQWTASANVGRS